MSGFGQGKASYFRDVPDQNALNAEARAHGPAKWGPVADKIMRYLKKLARDRTQNRYPLLLIARLALYAAAFLTGVGQVRVIIGTLATLAALATAVMLMGLPLDLAVAGQFYDPDKGRFLAATNPYVGMLRDNGLVAIITCVSAIIGALATRMLRLPAQIIPGRVVVFLVSTLALGPGLIVNVGLKDHWHRPRPVHVTEFGGDKAYVDWWNPRGTCERNCSFVSGEAASAAWMFAPAMLAPPQWRAAALAGAAVFTAVISFARMAAGGHFFTDVLFAVLLTMVLITMMHRVIFRWRRTAAVPA